MGTRYYPPILMYHSIDYQAAATKLSVFPEDFGAQMKYLRDKRYNVISLEALAGLIKENRRIPHSTVVVTFDDGSENNYTNAFSVLKEYGIPATVFLVSDWIGREGFLTSSQIREMSRYGIEFGSHSKTHANLNELSKEELEDEIILSKRAIEPILEKPMTTFSFPFGGRNPESGKLLGEAGYEAACITFLRDDSIKIDPYELKRIKISGGAFHLLSFGVKASGYYTWFKAHRWKKKK